MNQDCTASSMKRCSHCNYLQHMANRFQCLEKESMFLEDTGGTRTS